MSSVPVALWNLKVPSGGVKVPGYDDEDGSPLPYRITMAAIDSAIPSDKPSTLKLHKRIVAVTAESDDEDEDEEMDEGESIEEEYVICTLLAGKTYQQALDITMPEDDEVYFSVSGDLPVYLSGNYVTPVNMDSDSDDDSDDEGIYDLSPDEDELLLNDSDEELDSEEDELDDLENRIQEITYPPPSSLLNASEEEAPKGKKRPLNETEEVPQLVDTSNLSKSQKKKLKKQKLNSGEAAEPNGTDKKVQFAAKLEQGPTGGQTDAKTPAKPALAATPKSEKNSEKTFTLANGVVVMEHATGSGAKAKTGAKLGIRYIGKLAKGGKVFDQNKSGKPFKFTLGKGEVIKGWDIGLQGIQVGGQRKITIPAAMAYGSQRTPDIPPNSDLVFEVKCVSMN